MAELSAGFINLPAERIDSAIEAALRRIVDMLDIDRSTLIRMWPETGRIQVAVALREALVNAIFHGNLEVSSTLLEQTGDVFSQVVERRRRQSPYQDRRVHVTAKETRFEAIYVVRDEGPGFDPSTLPDPTDLANLDKPSGRGLLLIRTFMDEVRHNAQGNEIQMVMRRREGGENGENGEGADEASGGIFDLAGLT